MKLRRQVALLAVVGAVAFGTIACGDDSGASAPPKPNGGPALGEASSDQNCPPPNIDTIDPAVLTVTAEPAAPLVSGQPANFKITITNVSEQPVPLVFGSSQQANVLLSQNGKQVYDWSADRAFTQVLRCQTLAPGEAFKVELAETKPLPVPPGDYVLTARTVTAPYPPDFTTNVTVS